MTTLAHRIRLEPNNVQRTWLLRVAGVARFTYNWGLARWRDMYAAGEKPSWGGLNAELNALKQNELTWMQEIPWRAVNGALEDLGNAFTRFFRRVKAKARNKGYPCFKARKRTKPSFCIEGRALTFDDKRMRVPKLGWIRLSEPLRFPGKVLSARFTERAGHWYVSVQVEVDASEWTYSNHCETQAVVGVDLGLVDLAVLSTGERISAPRALRRYEAKLRRLNKELSRRAKGGCNRYKTRMKLAKLNDRIANIRRDTIHKLTAYLVRKFKWIGIEDLDVAALARTRLAKSVSDAAISEVRRQLSYKAPLAESNVVIVDRWYPSSKTCSSCGAVYAELALGERIWTCDACGTTHDRDENAAKNLKSLAEAHSATARCPRSAGVDPVDTKLPVGREAGSHVFT